MTNVYRVGARCIVGSNRILISSLLNLIHTLVRITRGVTIQFGSIFSPKKIQTDEIFIGSSWFGFHSFSKKRTGLIQFRLVWLIGLFKNTIKNNNILTNMYFMYET